MNKEDELKHLTKEWIDQYFGVPNPSCWMSFVEFLQKEYGYPLPVDLEFPVFSEVLQEQEFVISVFKFTHNQIWKREELFKAGNRLEQSKQALLQFRNR